MSKLVLHIPGGGTRDIKLDRDRITIGRRADNDVHLPYPAVSAEHAAIITVLDDSFLEDLQSTNGTLVNGKRVTKHFLRDHDAIDIGRVQLVYVTNDAELIEPLRVAEEIVRRTHEFRVQADSHSVTAPLDANQEAEAVGHLLAAMVNSSGEAGIAIAVPNAFDVMVPREQDQSNVKNELTSGVYTGLYTESRSEPSSFLDGVDDDNINREPASNVALVTPNSVSTALRATVEREPREATARVYLEVMNGPNAGQIAPVTKREFVIGLAGAAKALIRREGETFTLTHIDRRAKLTVNGVQVGHNGTGLAFGDAIDVAGVMLRFGRRRALRV